MSNENELAIDETAVQRRVERCIELAVLFKEVGKGNYKIKNKILAKFRLQEGVKKRTSISYFNDLVEAGIITITKGEKRWKYNEEEEWDLFRVKI